VRADVPQSNLTVPPDGTDDGIEAFTLQTGEGYPKEIIFNLKTESSAVHVEHHVEVGRDRRAQRALARVGYTVPELS